MILSKQKLNSGAHDIYIGGQKIQRVTKIKYLGMMIDDKIQHSTNKLSAVLQKHKHVFDRR